MLRGLQARGVPMICANPDLMVEKGDKLLYCAGALAQSYEAMGGTVLYAGKPHLPVYDEAFALVAKILAASRTAAPSTSAACWRSAMVCAPTWPARRLPGSTRSSFRACCIRRGMRLPTAPAIAALFKDMTFRPIGAQQGLRW